MTEEAARAASRVVVDRGDASRSSSSPRAEPSSIVVERLAEAAVAARVRQQREQAVVLAQRRAAAEQLAPLERVHRIEDGHLLVHDRLGLQHHRERAAARARSVSAGMSTT